MEALLRLCYDTPADRRHAGVETALAQQLDQIAGRLELFAAGLGVRVQVTAHGGETAGYAVDVVVDAGLPVGHQRR